MCVLSQIKFKVTLTRGFGTTLGQSTDYIPTLTPPLWKKKEQCTAEQLQLRALKNLKFSQVSGFSAVKKNTTQPQKNHQLTKPSTQNKGTRPSPSVTLPLYYSQNKK